ncbi:DNA topoisomerase IV subunit A [Limibaculum sp. M0105]|uniref:DNA topoisomerase 4 subunit A n=1 Tax=Thermohalobaculum xanthum TaxID=2753746 RepID=A0A8J7SF91_9RHOB|nr:DNA topoisomerase IV subunit A [Thermohalobaculum xanthum]MBK0399402.1 DNA topoisomerase IV subunit A [Thermohalobaculum xanthum]
MSSAPPDDDMQREIAEPLARALGERYLTYALSTIMHRALPDARDGLKPVHRRLLWAMRQLKLDPASGYKKSARVVGDVIGKFHPHGDQAVYDALVRAAQDFSLRYPLIDGQGNFGNIDGDGAAAMRYTESRLTAVAQALLDGLDEDAVDLKPTYDGEEEEPEVLPAAFPNLLANGATGIAVGMATSIPPHNVGEIAEALLHLIRHPEARTETLVDMIPGPDFPTGGVLVEPRESILSSYRTGRGSFRLRARWEVEDLGRGTWQIIVTEIPYQVQKSKLVERLAELITSKKVAILADVRDESAEDVRLVLEPRARTVDPAMLMETLFRNSDLEVRVPLNMNVLIDGRTPKVCGLAEVLRAFLDHRREVLLRRSRYRLGKIAHRLEVLEGYIIAFLNLDRIIEIIRTEDDPKAVMMAEDWSNGDAPDGVFLSDVQAEAILNMRLRSLRRLEEMQLRAERDELLAERADLEALVGDEALQWGRIGDEIRAMRDKFGAPRALRQLRLAEDIAEARRATTPWPEGARRTGLADAPAVEDVPAEALIEREPVTVVCSKMGWIRAMKGHIALDSELKYKDGDEGRFIFHAQTTDRILAFASDGRFFTLACDRLPGGRGMGEPVRLMMDLGNDDEIVALFVHQPGTRRLVASSDGDGFIVAESDVLAQTRTGRQVLNLRGGGKARVCVPVTGDHVAVVGDNRKLLVFPLEELPEMTRGKGVRLQKYKDGGLSDATTFALEHGLAWLDPAGRTRTERELGEYIARRASAGRMAPRGFPRDNRFT